MSLLSEIAAGLSASCPETRRRSVQRLPETSDARRLGLLLTALGDEDWRVRKEAVSIANELGPSDAAIAGLIEVLREGEDVGQRNAAVEVLSAFGEPAIVALGASLVGLDADGRKLAAEALGRSRDVAALPVLEALSADADANVRIAAIDQIADFSGSARERGVRILEAALSDEEVQVELAALAGLSRLKATVRWEALEAASEQPMLRATALGLAANGDDPRAALALAAALDDPRMSTFAVAVAGLAKVASERRLSWAELRAMTASLGERARARLSVGVHDAEPGPSLIVAALAGLQEAVDAAFDAFLGEEASIEAEVALRIFGQAAVSRAIARLREGEGDTRAALVPLLVALVPSEGDDHALQALRLATGDGSEAVASAALIALATLGGGSDLVLIADLVSAESPRLATAAEAALASLAVRHPDAARALALEARRRGEPGIVLAVLLAAASEPLFGAVEDDLSALREVLSRGDLRARRAAALAIGARGSPLGMELLRGALTDPAKAVRLSAAMALGQLRTPAGRPVGTSALIDLLRAADPEVVIVALHALGETGDSEAAEVLASFTRAPAVAVAVAAISALGRVDLATGLPALLEAARSEEAEVVKSALSVLEGSSDPRVLSCFEAALDHEAWDVRTLAAEGLALFGASEPLQRRLSRESSPLVREALERALELAPSLAP